MDPYGRTLGNRHSFITYGFNLAYSNEGERKIRKKNIYIYRGSVAGWGRGGGWRGVRLHRRGGRDGGGCELGIAASHLHKGQGSMPNGGKGWHYAFQTGREGSLERERDREWGWRRGGIVNSASLVQKEEVPGWLAAAQAESLL